MDMQQKEDLQHKRLRLDQRWDFPKKQPRIEELTLHKKRGWGTSLVVQWLRLRAPNAGGPGLTPGQGTRSHMPQLRVLLLQRRFQHVATKTRCSQINK